ncbi:MAG: 50S ribosomal protein L16 [Candidatus Riflebacteria bacterium]|nr:50S ribosomal protein L16 [Candidatus Riflebacteria bacterium]
MLMPKRTLHRKPYKTSHYGKAQRCNHVSFGEFGLQAEEGGWVSNRQIEAARISIARHMKRGGKVWIRVFPHQAITKKPAETRMGGGKGAPEGWVAVVKAGMIMYEVGGVTEETAREALRLAGHKLSVRTRFVSRISVGGGIV